MTNKSATTTEQQNKLQHNNLQQNTEARAGHLLYFDYNINLFGIYIHYRNFFIRAYMHGKV